MKYLKVYSGGDIQKYIRKRSGETKLGNCVQFLGHANLEEGLVSSSSKFVLLGLSEDIGFKIEKDDGSYVYVKFGEMMC